ncbi:hypothetical protein ACFXDJ_06705 [Streptomyces sp. NPDC059443]|uniref:hypothetical protein n=1 Tax=unclassified Streptomyces TaxID=2593676 RepID=UPI003696C4A7
MSTWDDLIDPGKVKALCMYGTLGLAIGITAVFSPPAAGIAVCTVLFGHWALAQIIQKRNGPAHPFDGPAELTHRARLEVDDLAHHDPAYREAAGYLDLAEEALKRAALPLPPA